MENMIHIGPTPAPRGSKLFDNEQPIQMVQLSPFWIDRFPVTNAEFASFIECGGYSSPTFWSVAGFAFIQENDIRQPLYWEDSCFNGDQQPVTGVSWWEAMAYSRFVEKELPSEAQWEYAAGFGKRTYPWGEEPPNHLHANYAPGCEPAVLERRTEPVSQYPAGVSASGCWDMSGNVGEWCLDNYSADYSWDENGNDPAYVSKETAPHIVRGGSGLHDEDCLRCSSRDFYPPQLRDNIVGIRCVRNSD